MVRGNFRELPAGGFEADREAIRSDIMEAFPDLAEEQVRRAIDDVLAPLLAPICPLHGMDARACPVCLGELVERFG